MEVEVKSVMIERKFSKKKEKEYNTISVVFPNGYTYTGFLTAEQDYIIRLNLQKQK
jgi:hypothetical protein